MEACIQYLDRELNPMTKSKLIVVWNGEDILSSSIEYFLAAQKDWTVVRISTKEKLDALILTEDSLHSDIVIIHQGCQDDPTDLPLQLLQDHPAIKVITLNLENNAMDVYRKQKIMVKQVSDLMTAIESEP